MKKLSPAEVFTPRRPDVNEDMYVSRPELEASLENAVAGTRNILIHGESGTGKTWLYRHTLGRLGVPTISANLANAVRLNGGLNAELLNLLDRLGNSKKVGYTEEKNAEVSALVAKGSLQQSNEFKVGTPEPFEACLAYLSSKANGRPSVLVVENLEQAMQNAQVRADLASCIVLLDDERYARYGVRLLLVGVPSGVDNFFVGLPNLSTIANRIIELPEVARLSMQQATDFLVKGFEERLNIRLDPRDRICRLALHLTDRVPQYLQEFALILARQTADRQGRVVEPGDLVPAAVQWARESLTATYGIVSAQIQIDERTNRAAGVIYVLGQVGGDEIRLDYLVPRVQALFPRYFRVPKDQTPEEIEALEAKHIEDMRNILQTLTTGVNPILRLAPDGYSYRFARPQYRLCIRAMLYLDDSGFIRKMDREDVLPPAFDWVPD